MLSRILYEGESQNIDLTPEIVDSVFNNNEFGYINNILFSGGEPTLNSDIIVYIIDKIIENNINVVSISMVTSAQIYSPEIILAFHRFNEYCDRKNRKKIQEMFPDLKLEEGNTGNHVRITFSTDQFHHPVNPKVKEAYYKNSDKFRITETGEKKEDEIYSSGFSTTGNKVLDYQKPVRLCSDGKVFC